MINKKLIKYCTMQYVILLFTANIYSMEYNIYNSGTEHSDGLLNICEHPSNNRPYICEVEGCGYSAKTKANLNLHMRKHSNNRPYKCEVKCCGYSAKTKSNFKRHMKITHSNNRPYECKVEGCGYSAKTKTNLNLHMRKHSNCRSYKREVGNYSCAFKAKDVLNYHIKRIHSNDRPYKCNVENCSYVFKTSSDLRRHMLRHIGVGVYKCNFESCNYITSDQSTLARHITSDHNTSNSDLSTKDDQITSMVTSTDMTPISSNIICKDQCDKANTKIKHSLFKTKYKCKQCQFITYNMQDIISHHVGHKN